MRLATTFFNSVNAEEEVIPFLKNYKLFFRNGIRNASQLDNSCLDQASHLPGGPLGQDCGKSAVQNFPETLWPAI